MKQIINGEHFNDENGNPAGGETTGTGINLTWQNGPLGRDGERKEPNGAFVEGVIQAALDRLNYYQASKFACETNAEAVDHLELALRALERRTAEREARAVEGTHTA
jgi:hypothetical protein